jgi:protein O-GlcNAc transferase
MWPARILYQACPLCEGEDIPVLTEADCTAHPLYHPALPPRMIWRRCGTCAHVFTEGYFSADAEAVLFGRSVADQTVGYQAETQRLVSARIVERVARLVGDGAWLDVGFGNGSLLFTAEEWGYTPVGLDRREDHVRGLRQLGYEAHQAAVDRFEQPGRFSVVSLADVLEHMPFPRTGLAAAHRLLRPGGVLFVSMPNMGCRVWRLLDGAGVNPFWGELEHFHNFTRERLCALLEDTGFKPVGYSVSERYRVGMEILAVGR